MFSGTLALHADDVGTSLAPVLVGRYGTGRPVLRNTTNAQGVSLQNPEHVVVAGLTLEGPLGSVTPTFDALTVNVTNVGLDVPGRLHGLVLDDLEVSGYRSGIVFDNASSSSTAGTTGAVVRNVSISNVLRDGVSFSVAGANEGSASWIDTTLERIRVSSVQSTASETGRGLALRYGQNFTVRQCEISSVGTQTGTHGGRGIELFLVQGALVEDCEVADVRSQTLNTNGSGFNVTRSSGITLRRNFVRDTQGNGINVFTGASEVVNDLVLAFNVFENAGSGDAFEPAAITLNGGQGTLSNVLLANNSVYLSSTDSLRTGLWVKDDTTNVRVINNVFVSAGNHSVAWQLAPDPDLRTEGNTLFHRDSLRVLRFNPWYTLYNDAPFYKGGWDAVTLAEVRLAGSHNKNNAELAPADAVPLETLAGAVSDPLWLGLAASPPTPIPVGSLGVLGASRAEKLAAYAPRGAPSDPAVAGSVSFSEVGLTPDAVRLGGTDARGAAFNADGGGYAPFAGAVAPVVESL